MGSDLSTILEIGFKAVAIILSSLAIFQLVEVRNKRHIDMYWKIYEAYTSDIQKKARKDTIVLRSSFADKRNSGFTDEMLIDFYSVHHHLSKDEQQKGLDTSVINRIRFLNLTGVLLKKGLINRDMLFELVGIGLEHDYPTMKIVLETHRKDHNTPQLYSSFENTLSEYLRWKKDKNYYFKPT